MKLTATGPSEPAPNGDGTWTGYVSLQVEHHGELLATASVAPCALPDVDDPDDLRDLGETLIAVAETADQEDPEP